MTAHEARREQIIVSRPDLSCCCIFLPCLPALLDLRNFKIKALVKIETSTDRLHIRFLSLNFSIGFQISWIHSSAPVALSPVPNSQQMAPSSSSIQKLRGNALTSLPHLLFHLTFCSFHLSPIGPQGSSPLHLPSGLNPHYVFRPLILTSKGYHSIKWCLMGCYLKLFKTLYCL